MDWLKYRVGAMVKKPDSTAKPVEIVEIRDQAVCEKATRTYYRNELGPYPADGVAVVRFGDRYGVYGDIHAGEWTVLEVYNLEFEPVDRYGS